MTKVFKGSSQIENIDLEIKAQVKALAKNDFEMFRRIQQQEAN